MKNGIEERQTSITHATPRHRLVEINLLLEYDSGSGADC